MLIIADHPLVEWLRLPDVFAVAIFVAAGTLFLIALFGKEGLTIRQIKIGKVGPRMRILAGIFGVLLFLLSIISFIIPHSDEPEHSHNGNAIEVSPELTAPITSSSQLPAPITASPACDSTIPMPRVGNLLSFKWESVEGASTYNVEVDCFGCNSNRGWYSQQFRRPWHVRTALGMRRPIYNSQELLTLFRRNGGMSIRWRVWAVDHSGIEGAKSAWCQVAFSGRRRRIDRP